jgi:hypothetical protein
VKVDAMNKFLPLLISGGVILGLTTFGLTTPGGFTCPAALGGPCRGILAALLACQNINTTDCELET